MKLIRCTIKPGVENWWQWEGYWQKIKKTLSKESTMGDTSLNVKWFRRVARFLDFWGEKCFTWSVLQPSLCMFLLQREGIVPLWSPNTNSKIVCKTAGGGSFVTLRPILNYFVMSCIWSTSLNTEFPLTACYRAQAAQSVRKKIVVKNEN